jgi:hypothetical protein
MTPRRELPPNTFLCDRLLLSECRASGRDYGWEPQQGNRVVIGGNPVLALDPAAIAAVDH